MTITTTASTKASLQGLRIFYAGWLAFSGMGLFGLLVVAVRRKSPKTQ